MAVYFKMQIDQLLDAKGLDCPLPLLKAKQALNKMQPGQTLEVLATDQGSIRDFQVFAEQSGNQLVLSEQIKEQQDEIFRHILQKA